MLKFYSCFLYFVFLNFVCFAQSNEIPKNWHLLSPKKDGFHGINLKAAYDLLRQNGIKSSPVIVAVLDSGLDTAHEDLKNVLWHNPLEISNNGVDDDLNGLIDDEYGWNFLGGADGRQIKSAGSEKGRIYHQYKAKYLNVVVDTTLLNVRDKNRYQSWVRANNDINVSTEDLFSLSLLEITCKSLKGHFKTINNAMGSTDFSIDSLEKFMPITQEAKNAKYALINTFKLLELESGEAISSIITQLDEYIEDKKKSQLAKETVPQNVRAEFLKDDYTNINDRFYGNRNVKGTGPMHGTHVAGLIAAQRNNGIGIDGVADDAKLMALRVVPDGDEYDKDIALAIFYAVDNGAKVINMSFGKPYSPEKYWVDSAIDYAAKHDVLIIHASGNDGKNLDDEPSFPSPYFLNHKKAENYITVGASSDPKINGNSVIADFTNYSEKLVNVFAPGVKIYSTVPHENNYSILQGTSMSSPIVSGLAALLRSYFPKLSAIEIKQVIEQGVYKPSLDLVNIPNSKKEKVAITKLCTSGGIVDAEASVLLAIKMNAIKKAKIN